MNILLNKLPFEHIIIDDFYDEAELLKIKKEIDFLNKNIIKENSSNNKSAKSNNGQLKRKGNSLFLDDHYKANRSASDILSLNRKLFADHLCAAAETLHPTFKSLKRCSRDTTLLNIYDDGDYYDTHFDGTILTAVTFFAMKKFEGGEFCFPEYDLTIESKDNRTVIFQGFIDHRVELVSTKNKDFRASISQFLNFV